MISFNSASFKPVLTFKKSCFVNESHVIIMFFCAFCCSFDQKNNKMDTSQVGVIELTTLEREF